MEVEGTDFYKQCCVPLPKGQPVPEQCIPSACSAHTPVSAQAYFLSLFAPATACRHPNTRPRPLLRPLPQCPLPIPLPMIISYYGGDGDYVGFEILKLPRPSSLFCLHSSDASDIFILFHRRLQLLLLLLLLLPLLPTLLRPPLLPRPKTVVITVETMETPAKRTAKAMAMLVVKTLEMTTATSPTATKLAGIMSRSPNPSPPPQLQRLSRLRPRSLSRIPRPQHLSQLRPRNLSRIPQPQHLSRPRPCDLSPTPRPQHLSRPRLPQTTTTAATMATTAMSTQVAWLPGINRTPTKLHVAASTKTAI